MHCDMLEGYSISTRSNSGQEFRELILIPELPGIPTDSVMPGMGSDSGIVNWNHTSALTLMNLDVLEGYSI